MDDSLALLRPDPRQPAEPAKLKVFISYSREDLKFADQLDAGLALCGFQPIMDRHGIAAGEDWKERLGGLIRDADTVVFVLSPASAESDICAWEVEEATRLGKRVLPILCSPLGTRLPPAQLRKLNYIFFYDEPKTPGSGAYTGLAKLVEMLNTDLDWIREHTRLQVRALEWEQKGRPPNRLLSGADVAEAKAWIGRRPKDAPEVTVHHLDFIRASEAAEEERSSAERRQLEAMAAAQEERAKALTAAEQALATAAQEQRKRARLRNAAFVIVSLVAVVAAWQWQRAEGQRQEFKAMIGDVTSLIASFAQRDKLDDEDFAAIVPVFTRGAAQGDANSMFILGFQRQEGQGLEQDYDKAREWYEKAAEQGQLGAMRSLGLLYDNGLGVPQDYGKARQWYEKAANAGHAGAMRNIGVLYVNGHGVPQDYGKARQWYEKAIAAGDVSAMRSLGLLYDNGQGVLQDYAMARAWYEKAIAQGNTDAMRDLGILYKNGQGVPQDYAKAQEWFEKAAAKGNTDAMTSIGALYVNGQGVAHDYAKAREWYEKAAAKGNTDAMNNLGMLYINGQGVPEDYAKAREWYEKAAAKGHARAKLNLERLPMEEAFSAGRFDEALALQKTFAQKTEEAETKEDGKPGKRTSGVLVNLSWKALFARDFETAIAAAQRSYALDPTDLAPETNRAHALLFLGRLDEARALYRAHVGQPIAADDDRPWERVIAADFAEFRQRGLTDPAMAVIERELGIAP